MNRASRLPDQSLNQKNESDFWQAVELPPLFLPPSMYICHLPSPFDTQLKLYAANTIFYVCVSTKYCLVWSFSLCVSTDISDACIKNEKNYLGSSLNLTL